jgi:NTE family protein
MRSFGRPDVLVLGGGGILGEAWMLAVLAGLEQETGLDLRECEAFVGTSAGSIVAATLAAGRTPASRLGHVPEPPEPEPGDEARLAELLVGAALRAGQAAAGAASTLVPLVLRSTAPAGALVRRAALSRVPRGQRSLSQLRDTIDRSGLYWDGRLRISAVELESGRRVMFGAPGAPRVSVGQAVQGSCAIPGVFRPVEAGGRTYVDGGAWSPTNMDAAPAGRGSHVLCLNPTGSMRPTREPPFGALGAISRSITAVEALALQRRGARVMTVAPDSASAAAMGANLMDAGPRAQVSAAGRAQGRRLGHRS